MFTNEEQIKKVIQTLVESLDDYVSDFFAEEIQEQEEDDMTKMKQLKETYIYSC